MGTMCKSASLKPFSISTNDCTFTGHHRARPRDSRIHVRPCCAGKRQDDRVRRHWTARLLSILLWCREHRQRCSAGTSRCSFPRCVSFYSKEYVVYIMCSSASLNNEWCSFLIANKRQSGSPAFRKFRRQLFHTSLSMILQPLKPGMTVPEVVLCPDGHYRRAVYGIGPYIADYPEQVLLACIVQNWCPRYVTSFHYGYLSWF